VGGKEPSLAAHLDHEIGEHVAAGAALQLQLASGEGELKTRCRRRAARSLSAFRCLRARRPQAARDEQAAASGAAVTSALPLRRSQRPGRLCGFALPGVLSRYLGEVAIAVGEEIAPCPARHGPIAPCYQSAMLDEKGAGKREPSPATGRSAISDLGRSGSAACRHAKGHTGASQTDPGGDHGQDRESILSVLSTQLRQKQQGSRRSCVPGIQRNKARRPAANISHRFGTRHTKLCRLGHVAGTYAKKPLEKLIDDAILKSAVGTGCWRIPKGSIVFSCWGGVVAHYHFYCLAAGISRPSVRSIAYRVGSNGGRRGLKAVPVTISIGACQLMNYSDSNVCSYIYL
jgi:hypothetical protein